MRTKGWKSQYQFDRLLADLSYSSLRFLKTKYEKDLKDFRSFNDLNDQENAIKYKQMQQRYSMILEELKNRNKCQEFFSSTAEMTQDGTLIIRTKDGIRKRYDVGYDEDYDLIVTSELDG